jgi:exopolysaccharide biosynthesis polyprenyl glycosylphosphotransferase
VVAGEGNERHDQLVVRSVPREEFAVGPASEVEPSPHARLGSAADSAPDEVRGGRVRGTAAWLARGGWRVVALATDCVMLAAAVGAAVLGAAAAQVDAHPGALVFAFPPLVLALLALRGMYRSKMTLRILDDLGHVVGATSVAAMVVIALSALTSGVSQRAELVARMWVFSMLYVGAGRLILVRIQRKVRAERIVAKRTLIVGAGRIGSQVEWRLREKPELGLRPIGYIDAHPAPDDRAPRRELPVLGGPDELERIARETDAEHVVLAFLSSRGSDAKLVPLVRQCADLGLEVSLVPRLFESINVRVGLEHIGGMPIFRLRSVRPKGWEFTVKHILDRVIAAVLIVFLSPVLLASILAVKLTSRGPVFFRQRRVGRDGRAFDLLKFRSMRGPDGIGDDKVSVLLPDDTAPGGIEGADRRTWIGKWLRRTSIDETPQLFNVLKGEMSIVGPRPERPEFVELFERRIDRYDDRHRVRAGITGWAQVHGLRGKTSLSDRVELDNFYIENWSLRLDMKILLMTVAALFQAAE